MRRLRRRLPTLSDLDTDNQDDYETMQSGSWDKGRGKRPTQQQAPLPTLGGLGSCWCGADYPHNWAGMREGAPHPRAESPPAPPALGHSCIYVEVGQPLPLGGAVEVCLICG